MNKRITVTIKKRGRGRPAIGGPGQQVGMRWRPEEIAAIDAWRAKQKPIPDLTDAIRELVTRGLEAEKGGK